MATKLETLKASVGYSDKPVLPTCMNCAQFTSERLVPQWIERDIKERGHVNLFLGGFGGYQRFEKADDIPPELRVEKNIRCSRHGFAVKKLGRCNDHELKKS